MPYIFVGQNGINNGPGTWTNGTFTGNVTIGGTLGVTGATTLASAGVTGALTVGTTLGVTGISTFTGGVAVPMAYKNGSTTVSNVDAAGANIPASINPSTYYAAEEFDRSAASYSAFGTNGVNYGIATPNTISAAIFAASNLGGAYVGTSSATQGGAIAAAASLNIVKSTTITYRWRMLFYVGTLSDATNPYTLQAGAFVPLNSTSASFLPFTGPYISYTHGGTNPGKWIVGSAVNNTRTTANSNVAATTGWHSLQIDLANGVYTFTLDGVVLGTVTDANMVTTPANGQGASIGSIGIVPDGASYAAARYAAIDRSDFYVTGLSR